MEPLRIGEIYEKISKDEIMVSSDFKNAVLETIENFGIELIKTQKYWTRTHPVDLIDQINTAILDTITGGKKYDGTEMVESEIDFHRKLRIEFYHIRRAVRKLLKNDDES